MIICGVDVETTGFSSTVDKITEIGAVLFDTETKQPVNIFNCLIDIGETEVKPEITTITGITKELLEKHGIPLGQALASFDVFSESAIHFVAHNAPFDKGFIENGHKSVELKMPEKPWIDTCADVPYPPQIKTRKLIHLAAEHGFLNPFAHRAIFDVLTMLNVLSNYDFEKIAARAAMPSIEIKAMVSFPNKDLAKARGFHWFATSKSWVKTIKENEFQQEKDDCDFNIEIIK